MITIDKEPIEESYYGVYTRNNSAFQYKFCIEKDGTIRWYHGIPQADLFKSVEQEITDHYKHI